jgi:hypothetical protein
VLVFQIPASEIENWLRYGMDKFSKVRVNFTKKAYILWGGLLSGRAVRSLFR